MNRSIHAGILLIFTLFIFITACENELLNPAEDNSVLEGEWTVEEQSETYKSKKSSYRVYISVSEEDSTVIEISNFYLLGYEDSRISGKVDGKRIELFKNQTIDTEGVTYNVVSGTGVIASDYRSIEWEYKVDDGSGIVDNVTASYVKI
ncbi:MAG: hypothetical protein ACLFNL_08815 [Bacteroidales bacterium]